MARFDVYPNPTPRERRHTPYFLDVQNNFISGLATRVVIPLRREASFDMRARNLNPLVQVRADALVLDTATLGAVPLHELRNPVANLGTQSNEIISALDALFGGY